MTVKYNAETMTIDGITDKDMEKWRSTFPGVDLKREIAVAETWLDANPRKRPKNCKRFLVNWFNRHRGEHQEVERERPDYMDEAAKRWES